MGSQDGTSVSSGKQAAFNYEFLGKQRWGGQDRAAAFVPSLDVFLGASGWSVCGKRTLGLNSFGLFVPAECCFLRS